jgi:hypothetical protein
MSEKQVRKPMKTRCYYTDYVNHAIRFYLSTPETLQVEGKRKADMENWMAVQSVFHFLTDEQKQVLTQVYRLHHRLPEGVRMYCEKTGTDEKKVWILVTKVNSAIAKRRGLV